MSGITQLMAAGREYPSVTTEGGFAMQHPSWPAHSCARAAAIVFLLAALLPLSAAAPASAQTAQGELEGRPAPVARRKCIGGASSGQLCNGSADCPGGTCPDRNVFNLSVSVHFNATAAELTSIQNMISKASEILFDVTDGQAQFGRVTIHDNAFSTTDADIRIHPATNETWWSTSQAGSWQVGGNINVSINHVTGDSAPGESLAHEFIHYAFDARDEYEARAPGCGMVTVAASCPDATTIGGGETSCLMDSGGVSVESTFTELCWGQGDPGDLGDVGAGNHDATNVTEQSVCRDNRSCWEQVVWSWPNTFTLPAGAPDPDANGATVDPTQFLITNDTIRVVLVLDESGSMMLESPSRMQRLQVAANDFVTLAENGAEVGIVSFASDAEPASGRENLAIAPLGANRNAWTTAIANLAPSTMTNIGAGLQRGKDLIDAAGGVTGNTFVVLMTDGLNNRPSPQSAADADLSDKVQLLLDAGIPVFVTCTGSDVGLESQCAEIAAGTGGMYVDSAEAAQLPQAFADFHERITGREAIASHSGKLSALKKSTIYVEKGSESATFTLAWHDPATQAGMTAIDPAGARHRTLPMPQGRYLRVPKPMPGVWQFVIDAGGPDSRATLRGYSRNPISSLTGGVRKATLKPGEPLHVYAFPRSEGGAVSHPTQTIRALITLPDGSVDSFELHDQGRSVGAGEDDTADDGAFSGFYKNTKLPGGYTILLQARVDEWAQSYDRKKRDELLRSPLFERELQLAAAVRDPDQIEKDPDDEIRKGNEPKPGSGGGTGGVRPTPTIRPGTLQLLRP